MSPMPPPPRRHVTPSRRHRGRPAGTAGRRDLLRLLPVIGLLAPVLGVTSASGAAVVGPATSIRDGVGSRAGPGGQGAIATSTAQPYRLFSPARPPLLSPEEAPLLASTPRPPGLASTAQSRHLGWTWPLAPEPRLVAPFDAPPDPWSAGHRGVDLLAAAGQTVLAPAPGIVSFARMVAGRPVVVVAHPGGLRSTLEPAGFGAPLAVDLDGEPPVHATAC